MTTTQRQWVPVIIAGIVGGVLALWCGGSGERTGAFTLACVAVLLVVAAVMTLLA
jgi:hypothetical protein